MNTLTTLPRVTLNLARLSARSIKQARKAEVLSYHPRFGANSFARTRRLATEATQAKIDYEAKYAEKLKQKAQQEGVESVEALKARIKGSKPPSASLRPSTSSSSPVTAPIPSSAATSSTQPASTLAKQPPEISTSSTPSLDKIMKIELLEKEDPKTIGDIWTKYHVTKDCISAVIPGETYKTIIQRSQKYPMFIVPLVRPQGIEFYLLQFSYHQCVFTSLLEYKTKGAGARPYLTLTHYPDLLPTKGIVLMHGELADSPRVLSVADAQFLAFQVQQFYVSGGERKLRLVEKFHEKPDEFDHRVLLEELEKMGVTE